MDQNESTSQNHFYLVYLLIFIFCTLAGLVYYYVNIINRPLPIGFSFSPIPAAEAQVRFEESSLFSKKKNISLTLT